jgi:hypothetical protein
MQTNPLYECKCAEGECKCPSFEKDTAMDARVDGIYRVVKGKINLDTIIPTCIEVAKEIEGLGPIPGKEKLELLQKILKQAVKDSDRTADEKDRVINTIDTVVPIAMQAAILASKSPVVAQVQEALVICCVPKAKKA